MPAWQNCCGCVQFREGRIDSKKQIEENRVHHDKSHMSLKVVYEYEEAAMNDVKWLWPNDNGLSINIDVRNACTDFNNDVTCTCMNVNNDKTNTSINIDVKCDKEYDSEVVLHDFKSNACMNNNMQYYKKHDRDVILTNHELHYYINGAVQRYKDHNSGVGLVDHWPCMCMNEEE